MNILILTGSPRPNGNSNFLAERFAEGAKAAGHTVTHLDTAHLDVHPCIACEHCHNGSGTCTFHDGFTDIRRAIAKADALVFAGPIYYFGLPAPPSSSPPSTASTPAATTSSSPRRPPSSSPWPTPIPTPPRPPSCNSARLPTTKAGPTAAPSSPPASGPPATPRTPLTPTRPTPSANLFKRTEKREQRTENAPAGRRSNEWATVECLPCGAPTVQARRDKPSTAKATKDHKETQRCFIVPRRSACRALAARSVLRFPFSVLPASKERFTS